MENSADRGFAQTKASGRNKKSERSTVHMIENNSASVTSSDK